MIAKPVVVEAEAVEPVEVESLVVAVVLVVARLHLVEALEVPHQAVTVVVEVVEPLEEVKIAMVELEETVAEVLVLVVRLDKSLVVTVV